GIFDSEAELPCQTGPLLPYTDGVVQALLHVTERCNGGQMAAYKAISAYLSGATLDAIPVEEWSICCLCRCIRHLSVLLCSYAWCKNQILGVDDRNNWNELQSNFCSVVMVRILNKVLSVTKGHACSR
ncbi:hypothetical protein B0H19DRAFT_1326959, partial [Mycena capillaripes]